MEKCLHNSGDILGESREQYDYIFADGLVYDVKRNIIKNVLQCIVKIGY